MNRVPRRAVPLWWWSAPLLLGSVVVSANAALAAASARMLALAGVVPSADLPGLAYWALLFGSLALGNAPAFAVFGAWLAAEHRDAAARAEVRAAVRWAPRRDHGVTPDPLLPPGPAGRVAAAPLRRQLVYGARFACALGAPVLLAGLLAGG